MAEGPTTTRRRPPAASAETGKELEVASNGAGLIARPQITPDEARQAVQEVRELTAAVLAPEKHIMKMKRRQKVNGQWREVEIDVLLKAGAEELAKFFGLSATYSELSTERQGKVFYASVKCSVLNRDGRILAESYGFFDSTERTDRNGNMLETPANTIVKMAQKRAYVGAVMAATGTSELFTQDLEDSTSATGPAGTGDVPEGYMLVEDAAATKEQVEAWMLLFARKAGHPDTKQAAEWLAEHAGKTAQGAVSLWWLGKIALGLIVKPDPSDPELPAEPVERAQDEPETLDGEVMPDEPDGSAEDPDDDGIPF